MARIIALTDIAHSIWRSGCSANLTETAKSLAFYAATMYVEMDPSLSILSSSFVF